MKDYLNNNVIIYKKQDNIEYIQFKKLLKYPEITHCYTLKSNDEISFEPIYKNKEKLLNSYEKVGKVLKIDSKKIIKPHQTHTANIEIVKKINERVKDKKTKENINESFNNIDGLLTNKKNIALLTTSADCTSLIFYDSVKKVIGSVHSGWRGTLKGIAKKTVIKMIEEYQCNAKDIICGICPAIRKCCFEVDEDVKDLFINEYSYMKNIEEIIVKDTKLNDTNNCEINKEYTSKQKYYIDTVEINKQLLIEAGLSKENILDSGVCTKCNSKDFHSYRAEKEKSGRNGAIICIKGNV